MAQAEDSLAVGRDKRSNAGAHMARLLNAEDDDDFYKTTYGGFTEENDDNDYETEESASDATDSDIDFDENEEVASDVDVEAEEKRKRRLVVTKAYKEPKKPCVSSRQTATLGRADKPKTETVLPADAAIDRTSLRRSTCEKTRTTEDIVREREARSAALRQIAERKHVTDVRRLTQEELLAEAKITEKINLRSLETFQKLELEKKKSRIHRQTYSGPVIRYHSVMMPVDDGSSAEAEINVDTDTTDTAEQTTSSRHAAATALSSSQDKCSRTFITFSDDVIYRRYFPTRRATVRRPAVHKSRCPVTGLRAHYCDPATLTPFANVSAFRVIRQTMLSDAAADTTADASDTTLLAHTVIS